jgi:multidrug resistance efflux pump
MNEPATAPAESEARPKDWVIPKPSWPVRLLFLAVAIAGVLLTLAAWQLPPFARSRVRTEDAYVQGHTTVIAPQVAGYVWHVHVDDFARVRAGQVLAEIDPRPFRQRVAQAQAELDRKIADLANNRQKLAQGRAAIRLSDAGIMSARAKLTKAVADERRSADLVRDGSLSKRENDADVAVLAQARAELDQSHASRDDAIQAVKATEVNEGALAADVEAARAALQSAQIDLGYTVIRAPQAGVLSEVGVRLGQFVAAGTPLMYMVPAERWVIANYKENQTHHIHVGQRAWFSVDALGGARINGRVERISPATGAEFSALKPDNATGNFTKVPQRIPVRISVDAGQSFAERLRPGMSVEVHVDTAGERADGAGARAR